MMLVTDFHDRFFRQKRPRFVHIFVQPDAGFSVFPYRYFRRRIRFENNARVHHRSLPVRTYIKRRFALSVRHDRSIRCGNRSGAYQTLTYIYIGRCNTRREKSPFANLSRPSDKLVATYYLPRRVRLSEIPFVFVFIYFRGILPVRFSSARPYNNTRARTHSAAATIVICLH